MAKLTFNNSNNQFFTALKLSVDEYFETNGLKKTGNWRLHLKTILLISTAIVLYVSLLFLKIPAFPALLMCGLLGFTFASIGFSVMHDGCHGSYSSKPWVNEMMGFTLNLLGSISYFWKQKHNIIHHTYTNVDGIDDDIAKSPLIRQCDTQKWVPAHRVQHLYLPFVYGITSIAWLFIMDYVKYFTRDISGTPAWKMTLKNHLIFWGTKLSYIAFYMVIPAMLLGFWPWLIGFIVMHVVMGATLALVFQLAHVVEHCEFEAVGIEPKHLESAWAEHQLRTTANFAMNNKVISWFVGGLNFQVEHHLFPKISHIHYPAISKILMRKCAEYNMPYHYYDTMTSAIASHWRFMKYLGQKPAVQTAVQAAA
jgi:linoleoyl-CoA desaturase